MDKQTRDRLVKEARRRFMADDNKALSHRLTMVSGGKPRSMPQHELEALLIVCADRLWKAGS